ncbi:S1C family serine protease [Olleya sp. HaHaR_3_96]|uniref:S1C family serine protease n=1 Tax=Olleya sp. HaHaR_3_96 TaxID=2745560 RepID=UPI001C4E3935|nr:trypsin-like peptidase domain-containing protein [Olleya sp. HaHaR_3_96]QXP58324.1 trypsin-like peptidase domain-containing protein [Olleya sp. HaHaR_3_96]
MKRYTIIFCLLISSVVASQSLPDLYTQVKSSVVVVHIVSVAPKAVDSNMSLLIKSSQGSGVLISEDGLIWTASHIVQTAELVSVEFLDGDIYEAEVISSNPLADVAIIKIKQDFDLKEKKPAIIGNSDTLKIGEDIFVVGAPYGLKQSISKGIVSGRHTPDSLSSDFVNIEYLQTDAAINHGNSGGPLFNMKGEIVGLISSMYSPSEGFNGIGFAVSSNTAKVLMKTSNIWTGMSAVIITGNIARALNIPQKSGLLVLTVSSKGAANKMGLRGGAIEATIDGVNLIIGGDIILNFAGITIDTLNFRSLINKKIEYFTIGDMIPITILRQGEIIDIKLKKE